MTITKGNPGIRKATKCPKRTPKTLKTSSPKSFHICLRSLHYINSQHEVDGTPRCGLTLGFHLRKRSPRELVRVFIPPTARIVTCTEVSVADVLQIWGWQSSWSWSGWWTLSSGCLWNWRKSVLPISDHFLQ
jgi:hypothetical protein